MSRTVSDQNKLVHIFESGTYASSSGTGQWIGLVTNHTPTETMGVQHIRYLSSANRNVDISVDGPADFSGQITYHPQDWKMLQYALGSCVDAGSPSPYTHV